MNNKIVKIGNEYIRKGNLYDLKEYFHSLHQVDSNEVEVYGEKVAPPIEQMDKAYVFTKLFTNACLYNRYDIVIWLLEFYDKFDPITKIAVRPTFNYTKHLTRRAKKYQKLHQLLVRVSNQADTNKSRQTIKVV